MFKGGVHSAILPLAVMLDSSYYSTCVRLRGFASQEKVGISGTMLAERPLNVLNEPPPCVRDSHKPRACNALDQNTGLVSLLFYFRTRYSD